MRSLAAASSSNLQLISDRISHCLASGGMDFDEDGAIAPLAFPDIQISIERLWLERDHSIFRVRPRNGRLTFLFRVLNRYVRLNKY